jgi:hypothetical protein
MTSTSKTSAATVLTQTQFVDGAAYEIDAADFTVPFGQAQTEIDEARSSVSVSAGDTHVKTLDDALTAGTGITITKTNTGADEELVIAANGSAITGINAANVGSGVLAHERGGLEADVSAYSGLLKITGGATSQATAETDYVTPSGAGTLSNKTLTTPTIASLTNAQHNHTNAAGGGQITVAAINSGAATSGYVMTANGSGGASWAASGGGGAAPIDITVTAGEALAERDLVFVDAATGTAKEIDIDASTPLVGLIRGIVNQAGGIANGATGTVRISGEVTGFSGLTAWSPVYASTTPGGYTQTKPSPSAGGAQVAVVPMGFATSATAVMVDPKPATYLKRATTANDGTLTIVHHSDPQGRERRAVAYVSVTASADVASYASTNYDSDVALAKLVYGGDICTGGTASASSELSGAGASKAFDNTDGTLNVWATNTGVTSATLQYDLGSGVSAVAKRYKLTRQPTTTGREPRDWTFQGSNNGTSWATLDTQTGITGWFDGVDNVYVFSNTTAYRYYRWNITANNGDSSFLSISEAEINEGASKGKLAQAFQLSSDKTIDKIRLYLKKIGTPTGTTTCRIETNSGSNPSGTLANANATVTVAESGLSTSYGWIEFDFATNFSLTGATTYWIVLSTDRTASSTNYVEWGADGSSPSYASGEMRAEASAAWSAESKDACFEVYQQTTAIDEPCAVGRWSGGTRDVGVRYDDGSGSNPNTNTTFKNTSGGSLDLTVAVEVA